MNLPLLKRAIPVIALVVILTVLMLIPHFDSKFYANRRYAQCASLSNKDPEKAMKLAAGWRKESPESLMGKHCEALALYATRDYAHAAEKFTELAKHVTTANPPLSAKLFGQAADSYKAAGMNGQAKEAEAAALLVYPAGKPAEKPVDKLLENNTSNSSATSPGPAK